MRPATVFGRRRMTATVEVLGYLTGCELCGQRALTRNQLAHDVAFVCDRCRQVAGWGDVDVDQVGPRAWS